MNNQTVKELIQSGCLENNDLARQGDIYLKFGLPRVNMLGNDL